MTDRELMEMAAKAAGLKIKSWWEKYPGEWWADLDVAKQQTDPPTVWNPLVDDGDALRLAVKLGLAIRVLEKCVFVESDPETLLGQSSVSELEMFGREGKDACTRRAIVSAAAEIGRAMP